ncbi:MAG: dihydrodipicolinate synthase family protein [Proteobacteria bacterium]|nr:dihydrodipicolinate synthase family protein [Pseudomonadota bacterium]
MAKGRFKGIFPMLYTYFTAEGGLDRPAMKAQVDACVAAGAHGLAILGIVGEFNKMNTQERRRVVEVVAEDLGGRLPLAVTVCETSIDGQIDFMRVAEAVRADWVILQPPPIKGIPEAELVRFFGAVAERAKLPVAIQNNPVNLDVWLSDSGLKTLHRNHPNVSLLKGEGPVHMVQRTIQETEGAFEVFCGLGGKELPMSLRAGCVGCVPAPDCIDVQVQIFGLMEGGKEDAAEALHRSILPLLYFMLHSPEHMLCYGKRLFARRAGIAAVHSRAPFIQPTSFSSGVVEAYAKGLANLPDR